MRNIGKKTTSLLIAALVCATATSLVGCSSSSYVPKHLTGVEGEVVSNGGFAVEKGDYVYFINGSEEYTADNTLGDVEKGALMRISKANLDAHAYDEVETVVPSLFVAQDKTAGVFLYGDSVYFASPTTEKERDGSIANSYLSFHSAKIDGSSSEKAIKDYYFRLENNTTKYRFVEVDDVVYCVYVDTTDNTLYSFNTETRTKTALVKGATSNAFYFDKFDLENPSVYYMMSVTEGIDSDTPVTAKYNQIYSVRADATAEVDKDGDVVSYTVSNGYTYSFDHDYLSDNLKGYQADDYTTFPYVNLGTLVLDGRGYNPTSSPVTQYNQDTEVAPATPNGYTYAIQSYSDNELLFTRKEVNASSSDGDGSSLYYLTDEKRDGAPTWMSSQNNQSIPLLALSTTKASAGAIYGTENGNRFYLHVTDGKIYKTIANFDGTEKESMLLVPSATSTSLLYIQGNYLYYYGTGTNGNSLYRVDYTGGKDDYTGLTTSDDYKPLQILDIDWNKAWYNPEIVAGDTLLYCNAQSYGSVAFNYINVVDMSGSGADGLMTYEELKNLNEKKQEVEEFIAEFDADESRFAKLLRYYFRTGETKAFDEFLAEAKEAGYSDYYRYSKAQLEEFTAFTTHDKFKDGENYYNVESYYYQILGVVKSEDLEAMDDVWNSADFIEPLPVLDGTENNVAKIIWTTVGIIVGLVAIGVAVGIPVVKTLKKKAKLKADLEATRVKKRSKIDVRDDKSIDVYATEEESEETKD